MIGVGLLGIQEWTLQTNCEGLTLNSWEDEFDFGATLRTDEIRLRVDTKLDSRDTLQTLKFGSLGRQN